MDLKRHLQRIRRDERGISLIELLITAVILNMVLFATLGLLEMSARAVPKDTERAAAIQEAQAGLYRMTRELRQAHTIVSGDADTITVNKFVGGVSTTVTYDCAASRCTRQVGTGTPELIIDRVVNGTSRPVFEYLSGDANPTTYADITATPVNARYVRAKVIVPGRGNRAQGGDYQHEIILADGLYMRNRDV